MRYLLTIFILIGCNTTKHLPPIPPIKPPLDDTAHVVDRTISPTIIRLDGTRSRIINGDGTGYFKKWQWRQILGKRFPIDSATFIVAHVILTKSGKYAWELEGWDNSYRHDKDTFNYRKP